MQIGNRSRISNSQDFTKESRPIQHKKEKEVIKMQNMNFDFNKVIKNIQVPDFDNIYIPLQISDKRGYCKSIISIF